MRRTPSVSPHVIVLGCDDAAVACPRSRARAERPVVAGSAPSAMGRSIWPTSDAPREASRARVRVSSPATTALGCASTARCRLRESLAFGGVRHWPTCPARPLLSMRRWTGFTVRRSEEAPFPSLAVRLEVVRWSGTSLSRVRSVSRARRTPSVGLDAMPHTKPKGTVVSRAWFEYWRCRPRRVPVGERAIGESEPDGQTPARAETRLVLPPITDTGGRLDVLPLGARDTRHAGPRISGWRAMIDRDRELCTKAPNRISCARRRAGV